MKKKINFSSVYYINNISLIALQNLRRELSLYYSCDVSYLDTNFFFLRIDWMPSFFKNNNISTLKEAIALNEINSKQSFLLPVAIIMNGGVMPFSYFIRLCDEDESALDFEQLVSSINIHNPVINESSIFLSSNNVIFNYIENLYTSKDAHL